MRPWLALPIFLVACAAPPAEIADDAGATPPRTPVSASPSAYSMLSWLPARATPTRLRTSARGDLVVVAGRFSGTVDFGDGPKTAQGASDGFVAAWDLKGHLQWSRAIADGGLQGVVGLAVTDDGRVGIAGARVANDAAGASDVHGRGHGFVATFARDGASLGEFRLGGDSLSAAGHALASTREGWLVVLSTDDVLDVGGARFEASADDPHVNVLAWLDGRGEVLATLRVGGWNAAIATSAKGTWAATTRGVDTSTGSDPAHPVLYGEYQIVSGERAGVPSRTQAVESAPGAMAFSPDGDLVVVGAFSGTTHFGSVVLANAEPDDRGFDSPCYIDGFVARLSGDLTPRWAVAYGAAGDDEIADVAVAPNGTIHVVGTRDFACESYGGPLPGTRFATVYGGDGALLAHTEFGPGYEWQVAVGADGSTFALGDGQLTRMMPAPAR